MTQNKWISPVTLQGEHVILEPMSLGHVAALQEAIADGQLWKLWYTFIPTSEKTEQYVQEALEQQAQGAMLPFVVRHKDSGKNCWFHSLLQYRPCASPGGNWLHLVRPVFSENSR